MSQDQLIQAVPIRFKVLDLNAPTLERKIELYVFVVLPWDPQPPADAGEDGYPVPLADAARMAGITLASLRRVLRRMFRCPVPGCSCCDRLPEATNCNNAADLIPVIRRALRRLQRLQQDTP
jgi:hypothetical protein